MIRRDALKNMLLVSSTTAASWIGIKANATEQKPTFPDEMLNPKKKVVPTTSGMKVLLVNGSPNKEGCTYTALQEIAGALEKEQVESEIIHVGSKSVAGCKACGACRKSGKCIIDDIVNEVIDRLDEFDGFIFGTPVHYAAASGFITPFLDRLFYASSRKMAYKPGAAIACCRRAGSVTALDQLNKYFTINNMPVVSSQYWNMVYGAKPEDVKQDLEGLQIMRTLGKNMAWLLSCLQAGKAAGINYPAAEPHIGTNFIR